MSDADGALDSVRDAFQGKRGKVLIVGGGVAVAAYVWWTRRNGTPEPAPDATDTPPTVGDGPSGRTPQTDPEVGNTSTGSTAVGPRKYDNNGEWLSDATDFLAGRGVSSVQAYNALNKALAGQPLTTQEISWVSQAIGALKAPPEGMPPLNASAPAPTGSTQGNAAITGLKVTSIGSTSMKIDWAATGRPDQYRVYVNGALKVTTASTAASFGGLKRGTTYTITVTPITRNVVGKSASVRATTKK